VFIVNRLPASVWWSISFAIADVGSLRSYVYFGISDGYFSPPCPPLKNPHIGSRHHRFTAMALDTDAGRAVGTLFVGSGVDTDIPGSEFMQTCD